jgi:predicted ATP-dependent protease
VSLDEPTQEVRVSKDANDPIDILTVKRLKDILKSQGLKTSGNKQELKDRLRKQVNSLMQGKQSPPK